MQTTSSLIENIDICIELADHIRSTLGPFGRDKLLIQSVNIDEKNESTTAAGATSNMLVTNDGACLLTHLPLQHPAAILIREVCQAQDRMVGDGTTSTVLLTAELLRQARDLLTQYPIMHERIIIQAYRESLKFCLDRVRLCSLVVSSLDSSDLLRMLVQTCIHSKIIGFHRTSRNHFAQIITETFVHVSKKRQDAVQVADMEKPSRRIGVLLQRGDDMLKSQCAHDTILIPLRNNSSSNLSRQIYEDRVQILAAKGRPLRVLLCRLDSLGQLRRSKIFSAQIRASSQNDIEEISQFERKDMENLCQKIVDAEVDIVLNGSLHSMHALAVDYLWSKGQILSVGRLTPQQMELCASALGCSIIGDALEIGNSAASMVGSVVGVSIFQSEASEDGIVLQLNVDTSRGQNISTLVIQAQTDAILAECDRAVNDAVRVLDQTLCSSAVGESSTTDAFRIVVGGGCIYADLAAQLRRQAILAQLFHGKASLVANAFAGALEQIPMILASNAGLDASALLAQLRQHHSAEAFQHEITSQIPIKWFGMDLSQGIVREMVRPGQPDAAGSTSRFKLEPGAIIEPVSLIESVLRNSVEAAEMILRIDQNVFQKPQRTAEELGMTKF